MILLKPRRYLQLPDRIVKPDASFGLRQWVLARPLYRLQSFSLPQVAARDRVNAAILQAKRLAPFASVAAAVAQPKSKSLRDSGRVWVALWDAEQVEVAQRFAGVISGTQAAIAVMPESFLRAGPAGDDVLLLQTLAGTEAQVWRAGELVASQAWVSQPSEQAWQLFCRENRVSGPSAQHVPKVTVINLAPNVSSSFTVSQSNQLSRTMGSMGDGSLLNALLPIIFLALALATLGYTFRYWQIDQAIKVRESNAAAMRTALEPLATRRSQAQALVAEIQAINELEPFESQVALLNSVSKILPKDGTHIGEWQYSNGNLKLWLNAGTQASPIAGFVERFQSSGLFNEVRAANVQPRQGYALEMRVISGKRVEQPAPVAASAQPSAVNNPVNTLIK